MDYDPALASHIPDTGQILCVCIEENIYCFK